MLLPQYRLACLWPWWVSPVLVLTLLLGPVGLLVYLLARTLIGGANVAADPA